jgi:hypothetical protein
MTVVKYDWEHIRIEYVQGRENGEGLLERPTLEALAKEYGIPPGTVRNRAHREGWVEERHVFVTSLLHKTRERTLEQLADKASQLDAQAFSVARAMFIMSAKRLNQSLDPNLAGKELTLNEQERLLKICDLAHKMGRRALGVGDKAIHRIERSEACHNILARGGDGK